MQEEAETTPITALLQFSHKLLNMSPGCNSRCTATSIFWNVLCSQIAP